MTGDKFKFENRKTILDNILFEGGYVPTHPAEHQKFKTL